jgi:hypothetical protein
MGGLAGLVIIMATLGDILLLPSLFIFIDRKLTDSK